MKEGFGNKSDLEQEWFYDPDVFLRVSSIIPYSFISVDSSFFREVLLVDSEALMSKFWLRF